MVEHSPRPPAQTGPNFDDLKDLGVENVDDKETNQRENYARTLKEELAALNEHEKLLWKRAEIGPAVSPEMLDEVEANKELIKQELRELGKAAGTSGTEHGETTDFWDKVPGGKKGARSRFWTLGFKPVQLLSVLAAGFMVFWKATLKLPLFDIVTGEGHKSSGGGGGHGGGHGDSHGGKGGGHH